MARKFLYFVLFCIILFIAGRLALAFYPEQLTRLAFVPSAPFAPQPELAKGRYDDPAMWIARPGITGDPAHWAPPGAPPKVTPVTAAVFFVHPTAYLSRGGWNDPLDDKATRERTELFVLGLASPFAGAESLWIPRYRQATLGAFLTDKPDATSALDLAFGDVVQAFDAFLTAIPAGQPIVLAGHSQGAFHLRRLLAERVAGKPLARRIAAAYLVGWPLSLEHDLPRLGLKPCAKPGQPRCVMSWMSYGEPGDPEMTVKAYARNEGLDGKPLRGSAFLCSNPLTGGKGDSAPAAANLGTLVPDGTLRNGRIVPAYTGASCRTDGALSLGGEPAMGPYVFPGNNYHVYDIPLFWMNLRADFEARVSVWHGRNPPPPPVVPAPTHAPEAAAT
jgi:hypothetical protein